MLQLSFIHLVHKSHDIQTFGSHSNCILASLSRGYYFLVEYNPAFSKTQETSKASRKKWSETRMWFTGSVHKWLFANKMPNELNMVTLLL